MESDFINFSIFIAILAGVALIPSLTVWYVMALKAESIADKAYTKGKRDMLKDMDSEERMIKAAVLNLK